MNSLHCLVHEDVFELRGLTIPEFWVAGKRGCERSMFDWGSPISSWNFPARCNLTSSTHINFLLKKIKITTKVFCLQRLPCNLGDPVQVSCVRVSLQENCPEKLPVTGSPLFIIWMLGLVRGEAGEELHCNLWNVQGPFCLSLKQTAPHQRAREKRSNTFQ